MYRHVLLRLVPGGGGGAWGGGGRRPSSSSNFVTRVRRQELVKDDEAACRESLRAPNARFLLFLDGKRPLLDADTGAAAWVGLEEATRLAGGCSRLETDLLFLGLDPHTSSPLFAVPTTKGEDGDLLRQGGTAFAADWEGAILWPGAGDAVVAGLVPAAVAPQNQLLLQLRGQDVPPRRRLLRQSPLLCGVRQRRLPCARPRRHRPRGRRGPLAGHARQAAQVPAGVVPAGDVLLHRGVRRRGESVENCEEGGWPRRSGWR